MQSSEFFEKYPESKELFDQFMVEMKRIVMEAQRPANEVLISDAELIRQLGVCKRTTNTWRSKRLIEFIKIGSLIFYRYSEVLAFMARHEIKKITTDNTQKKRHGKQKL